MVFCGRPSKACQRCRERRLKCDLRKSSCGQCNRAKVICTGYRDTHQLRIRNESQSVRRRAISIPKASALVEPRSLALSLEWQARETFFTYHVTGTSKAWDFLAQFYDQPTTAEHLKFSIDAVSLAYLAHQSYSAVALVTARERYISALHMTNKALQSPESNTKDTILLSSLLLDLFEKITNCEPRYDRSWTSHAHGALAVVRSLGFEHFRDSSALRVLVRLSTNLLISCVASESSVPEELISLRVYAAKYVNVGDPKWRLSGLMVHYANLQSDVRRGLFSAEKCICLFMELDAKLLALALEMPPSWQYKTSIVDGKSETVYDQYFDSYPDRHTTQAWNVLRLVRILLNESVIENSRASTATHKIDIYSPLITLARNNIKILASEICASVPQYVSYHAVSRGRLSNPEEPLWVGEFCNSLNGPSNLHSPSQSLDCYTVIFPLYVAGRSINAPKALKPWIINQLYYISSHFNIRKASVVAQILEQNANISPWSVYAMLGSYAFIA